MQRLRSILILCVVLVTSEYSAWSQVDDGGIPPPRAVGGGGRMLTPEEYERLRARLDGTRRGPLPVEIGVIQEKCLISYDDSHQMHSVDTYITWTDQRTVTTMKKLEHCYKLTLTGPVDIGNLGREYVQQCIDKALNDNKTLEALKALGALVADIYGGHGTVSAANAYAYVDKVSTSVIGCVTDSDKITNFVGSELKAKFNGTVTHESHWVFWEL